MNHLNNNNDENTKAPITRVFKLSGLRKQNHRGTYPTSTLLQSADVANEIESINTTTEKNVYVVGDLSINRPRELNKYTSENENIKLAPTPITPLIENKLIHEKLFVSNDDKPNEIIAQHVSEIDLDEVYVSKKFNPVYKSDSEDEKEEKIHAKNLDFDDYQGFYQDPAQVHQLFTNEFQNLSIKSSKNDAVKKENISVVDVNNINNDEIYATINDNDLYLSPIEVKTNGQNMSIKEKYVKDLKADMLKEFMFISINKNHLKQYIAVVCLHEKLWIAGLSPNRFTSSGLHRSLYIGDLIVSVNNETINTLKYLQDFVDRCKSEDICLKIKRLPFARVIFIPLGNSLVDAADNKINSKHVKSILGIKIETSKPRIEKIEENGLVYKNSLRFNPNSYLLDLMMKEKVEVKLTNDEKSQLTTWTLTEINGNIVSQSSNCDKVAELLFNTKDNEICLIVQPTDLMKALCKELKKTYDNNWKNYTF